MESSKGKQDTNKEEGEDHQWSEEEEILLLDSILKFSSENEVDPAQETRELFFFFMNHHHHHPHLHHVFSEEEVSTKVKRIKKGYQRNIEDKNAISSPHEMKIFEMSKNIWGDESVEWMNELRFLNKKLNGWSNNLVSEEAMQMLNETQIKQIDEEFKEREVMKLEVMSKRAQMVEYVNNIMFMAAKRKT